VARALPFASMIDVPIEVFLGRRAGSALAGAFAVQLAWLVVLVLAGRAVLTRAMRRVEILGG
jgi:ABC-2 type transport system permease protein